jgi:hypothetical protein
MPKDAEARDEAEWGVRSAIDEILATYGNYGRQYLGIVLRSGDRRVLVNCFPRGEAPDWKQRWFRHDDIDDGGPSLWRIQYDVGSGRFLGFDVNPSA